MCAYTCAYQGVRNVRFSENLTSFFPETLVLRFALLPYYRRNYELGCKLRTWLLPGPCCQLQYTVCLKTACIYGSASLK